MKQNLRTTFNNTVVCLLTTIVLTGCGQQTDEGDKIRKSQQTGTYTKSTPSPNKEQLPQLKPSLLRFTLHKDNSYEDAGTAKVIWEIILPSNVTKESLTNLLNDLYSQALSRRFKQHNAARVVDIKAYMSKQHAESGLGQWIGWLSKSGDQIQPNLSYDERQINQIGKQDDVRNGLHEDKRKEIWQEVILAERRAIKEAEKKYHEPTPQNPTSYTETFEKREKLTELLLNKYHNELAKRYSISTKQLTEITDEGLRKSWPIPK